MTDSIYIRKPQNIYRQFWPYLFANFCIAVALALNELLNGIIVSNLLGGEALATLNLTFPLSMIVAAFYTLCGFGTSIATGNVLGKRDVNEAGKIFTVSVVLVLILGIVFSLAGFIFRAEIAMRLAGGNEEFLPDITHMVGIISAGGLFMIFIPFIAYFIRVEGQPGYSVLLMTLANLLNVALTALFITVFNLGIESAAFSLVVSYFAVFLLFLLLASAKKIPLRLTPIGLGDFARLGPMLVTGLPATVSLLLLALQINIMNRVAFEYAGVDGVVIFSVCLGVYSLAGMFYQGVTDTLPPILSVLRGAGDVSGQRYIIKRVFLASAVLCVFILGFFEAFPQFMMNLYNLKPGLRPVAADCIRLYAVGISFLVFVLFFLDYMQSIERKVFAMVISILKNVGCILPFVWLFSELWGIRGIMLAFSAGTVLTILIIAVHNLYVSQKSNGSLKGFLLLPTANNANRFEATIPLIEKAVVELSEEVECYCIARATSKKASYFLSLAVEELAMFIILNRKNSPKDRIDVFLNFEQDEAALVFCVSGKPFDVYDHVENSSYAEEITNLMVLKKISDSISFERILLMNRTIINFNMTSFSKE